ncbi:UDP-N-acetylmuramate dehydrogenase [Selenomonas sp. FOBRC6]|uniref:UDP-N-acetylmuramate dehydrogenase n=1 Tax=Selenomonas sp. FOBRC6 TaxID=936572 RepID=UPI000277EB4B|nr:UDP-N-acetylmuramate dehydrogenase [Selenomonas sp. FOBRC6]EJO22844.1 UDP-N-acetylmuramate dehydrogenase [Selenomonas sp. FOBRC6]
MNKDFVRSCYQEFDAARLFADAPMRFHTTFRIGGPADLLFYPQNTEEVQKIIRMANEYGEAITLLGNGSNILVRDGGIRGLVIRFSHKMAAVVREGTDLIIGAGALLCDAAARAQEYGLSGLEFACGIPGSIGGAIFMNAGAYDDEMKSVVVSVKTITRGGELHLYSAEELDFGYRHSIFHGCDEAICETRLHLHEDDKALILARMEDLNQRRESKQPLSYPSAGSTFKRPPGYFAGTLIDQTGLKGLTVGGAQVSQKHAGFVINIGNATADDVQQLISIVQKRVYAAHGVQLFPELRIIGEA